MGGGGGVAGEEVWRGWLGGGGGGGIETTIRLSSLRVFCRCVCSVLDGEAGLQRKCDCLGNSD